MKVAKEFLATQTENNIQLPSLDKVELRALLQLLNKKVDSTTQLFPKDIIVRAEDIYDLNYRMKEKLSTSNIFIASTVVSIKYNNQKTMQFTTWDQFQSYSWEETSSIRNITLIWEFYVDVDGYQVPQKHTVVVRISSGMKMEEMLQLIMTGKIEEIDSLEQSFIPIVCRVDFVNTLLADEIINLVDKWNKGLNVPVVSKNILYRLKKYKSYIISVVDMVLKVIIWAMIILLIIKGFEIINIQEITKLNMLQLRNMILGGVGLVGLHQLLEWVAKILINTIQESFVSYGKTFTFDITKGDKKQQQKIKERDKKSVKNLIWNILLSFILGVCSSIVATGIIEKLFN